MKLLDGGVMKRQAMIWRKTTIRATPCLKEEEEEGGEEDEDKDEGGEEHQQQEQWKPFLMFICFREWK